MLLFLLIIPVYQVVGQLPDADQIISRCRDLTMVGSMSATLSLTITEKNGAIRNRKITLTTKSFSGGLEKRFLKFMEPADVKGTAMLVVDNADIADEMWIYLPALKKTRRIASSEKGKSFMSSEFSNADMSSPPLTDFINRHCAGSGSDNQWIIESIPANEEKADEYGYSRKVSYIIMDKYQAKKMEFYNFDGELFKTMEIKSTQPLSDGKYMISNMIANNFGTGRKSEILLSNITEQVKVEDTFFTVQNLER